MRAYAPQNAHSQPAQSKAHATPNTHPTKHTRQQLSAPASSASRPQRPGGLRQRARWVAPASSGPRRSRRAPALHAAPGRPAAPPGPVKHVRCLATCHHTHHQAHSAYASARDEASSPGAGCCPIPRPTPRPSSSSSAAGQTAGPAPTAQPAGRAPPARARSAKRPIRDLSMSCQREGSML